MQARLGLSAAALAISGLAFFNTASCSSSRDESATGHADASAPSTLQAPLARAVPSPLTLPTQPLAPNYNAGPVDESHAVVQRGPMVSISLPSKTRPFRDIPNGEAADEEHEHEHEPGQNPLPFAVHTGPDEVVQSDRPVVTMPATIQSFLGQGTTMGGCIFPRPDAGEPPGCTTRGVPPDTVGAVGPNHYVQAINSGIAIWNKNGTIAQAPKFTSALFAAHPRTDGNKCGDTPAQGGDWGDAVVLYDQLADRWFITQFDIGNGVNNNVGPSYQCVAISQTGDPTGAYYTYDFQYTNAINDYGKFSVWPDAYYASFNMFDGGFSNATLCAYDRVSMINGQPATQQCFNNGGFAFLPSNLDGPIKPPVGTPGFFLTLGGGNSLKLYKLKVDWVTPANSSFTGPTTLPVAAYSPLCNGGPCVPQLAPGNQLGSIGDRPMFRLVYRNFGTHAALLANHSVKANGAGGVRWYEIRSPNAAPVVFQQGTYAPNDGKWRWMASLTQDQAQDIALGYAISSSSMAPSIGWTGRVASDPVGTMGQAEGVVIAGGGVETGFFKDGVTPANRWGDYSNMTLDPTDDCTFWYTQEIYPSNGVANYDTRIASVKFPGCAANDFGITLTPASQTVAPGASVTYTVGTTNVQGTSETIVLNIQDLPTGVTAAFAPATVTAGSTSTLTLTAAANAPLTGNVVPTITVIGKAPSAVHAASAKIGVGTVTCVPLTVCPGGQNCASAPDGCGGTLNCGTCAVTQTCSAGHCVPNGVDAGVDAGPVDAGKDSGAIDAGKDSGAPVDSGTPDDSGFGSDSGSAQDSGAIVDDSGSATDSGDPSDAGDGTGGSSGCGCRTAESRSTPSTQLLGFGSLAMIGALGWRRRRAKRAPSEHVD